MTTYFVSNAGSNTAPYDTEAKAATTLGVIQALPWLSTDVVKVSSTHTETAGAALTYNGPTTPGLQILSVLFNGAGTGALTVGAAIKIGAGTQTLTFGSGFAYLYGLSLNAATGSGVNAGISFGVNGAVEFGWLVDTCNLVLSSSNVGARLSLGSAVATNNVGGQVILTNCTSTAGAARPIRLRYGNVQIDGLVLAGTAPTTLFEGLVASPCTAIIRASNLAGAAWTNLLDVSAGAPTSVQVEGCQFPSSFVLTTGAFSGPGGMSLEVSDCNSGDVNYYYARSSYLGTVLATNTVYESASDGTNSFSLLMTGNANTTFVRHLESPPISQFNSTLSAMTTTVEVATDNVTVTDAQLWNETLAKITSGVPLGTWNYADRAAGVLTTPTNQDASTATWTGVPGTPVTQKLVSGSFTPAEVGPITTIVHLGANIAAYVSPKILATSAKQWRNLQGSYVNEQPAGASGGGPLIDNAARLFS